MYEYPKIPRHGLDLIDDSFWEGELIATEKVDGGLFRFTIYDERYEFAYPDSVTSLNPSNGDVVAGTSDYVRWKVTPETGAVTGEVDGTYDGVVGSLSDIDVEAVFDHHDTYGSPVVFFAEAMVGHLIPYDDTPELVGFDVFVPSKAGHDSVGTPADIEPNPYERDFNGFLSTRDALTLFADIGVQPVTDPDALPTVHGSEIDPETMTIPTSAYGDVQAEGVVFRDDESGQRVKVRSGLFEEVKDHHHSHDSGGEADPVERFVATYCTPVRVQKIVMKMVSEEGRDLSRNLIEPARHRVYDDIWREEWRTIKDLNYEINPAQIRNAVSKRTAEVVNQMVDDDSRVATRVDDSDAPFEFEQP